MSLPEGVKHSPEQYEITIVMSKEDYDAIKKNADWDMRGDIRLFMIRAATNYMSRGC